MSNDLSVPMDNTVSNRLTVPINNGVCQCTLVNSLVPQLMEYCCQMKVNKGNMKMFDYLLICPDIPRMVDVSRSEEERLKDVWTKNGNLWTECPETREIKFKRPDGPWGVKWMNKHNNFLNLICVIFYYYWYESLDSIYYLIEFNISIVVMRCGIIIFLLCIVSALVWFI